MKLLEVVGILAHSILKHSSNDYCVKRVLIICRFLNFFGTLESIFMLLLSFTAMCIRRVAENRTHPVCTFHAEGQQGSALPCFSSPTVNQSFLQYISCQLFLVVAFYL